MVATHKAEGIAWKKLCAAMMGALAGMAMLTWQSTAIAQDYPSKPVRIVISFGPGSGIDIVARLYSEQLRVALKQPFIIDYKAGASGRIGAEAAARAAPDGYTLYVGSNTTQSANPFLFKKLNYDPIKDFTPISYLNTFTSVLVVDPKLPVKSVAELIAYGKANPGKLRCSYGNTSAQVGCASLFRRGGIDGLEVAYKTNELAIADILSGEISLNFVALAAASALIKADKLRVLGIAKTARSPLLPGVPAVSETPVMAGFDIASWIGLFGPAGLPRPIVILISTEVQKIAAKEDNKSKFAQLSAELKASTPEELAEIVASQYENWGRRIKEAGIEPECSARRPGKLIQII